MAAEQAPLTLSDIASRFNLELRGDPDHRIETVATLKSAGPQALSFFSNPRYRKHLQATAAGAVVISGDSADLCPGNCLISDDPYLDYARIAVLFDRRAVPQPGIHPSAVVDSSAQIAENVHIGPQAVVAAGCRIADGAVIGPGCILAENVSVGAGSRLVARVTLGENVHLGRRVLIHPGAVLGADGFGIAFAGDRWQKVPQLGGVQVGDDCEIGANTTIDRGAIEDTVLEEDVRLDNLVQVGHNVHIGAHTAIAGGVLIAGSARIGRYCLIAGGAGINGHIKIADKTTVAANAMVIKSIREPGGHWSSLFPAQPVQEWNRNVARLRRLSRSSGAATSPTSQESDDD